MIATIDLLRAARVLVTRHGDDAELAAAAEADRQLADGRLDGARLWRAVLRACAIARLAPGPGCDIEILTGDLCEASTIIGQK